nr:hypothetical protein [Tissierella sp.]
MFYDVMLFILIASGLVVVGISTQEYIKIKKDIKNNSETKLQKRDKTEAIIYIILNLIYLFVCILLWLEVVSLLFAVSYMILSNILERIVQHMLKNKYGSI